MPKLISYCIPVDDGAAPNPFWGICTLAICKPRIRRTAEKGDWVVGTGSRNSPIGDMSGQVVYAMKVTQKLTMRDYDAFAAAYYPEKVPDWHNDDRCRRLGDAIYDFSSEPPRVRESVHTDKHRVRDLGGEYVLLSEHFYYFGNRPVPLPDPLRQLARQGQGHQSTSNQRLLGRFLLWLDGLNLTPNRLYGGPQRQRFDDLDVSVRSQQTCTSQGREKPLRQYCASFEHRWAPYSGNPGKVQPTVLELDDTTHPPIFVWLGSYEESFRPVSTENIQHMLSLGVMGPESRAAALAELVRRGVSPPTG
jgi:hypothetical protein